MKVVIEAHTPNCETCQANATVYASTQPGQRTTPSEAYKHINEKRMPATSPTTPITGAGTDTGTVTGTGAGTTGSDAYVSPCCAMQVAPGRGLFSRSALHQKANMSCVESSALERGARGVRPPSERVGDCILLP